MKTELPTNTGRQYPATKVNTFVRHIISKTLILNSLKNRGLPLLLSILPLTERPPVVSSEPQGTPSDASYFTVEMMWLQGHKAMMSSSKSTDCC